MPKVKPLGTPVMKAKAMAKRADEASAEEGKKVLLSLKNLRNAAEIENDPDFAELIGVSFGRYRAIKKNPLTMTLEEVRRLCAIAGELGVQMYIAAGGA